jgi:hypothetical protein
MDTRQIKMRVGEWGNGRKNKQVTATRLGTNQSYMASPVRDGLFLKRR